MSRHFRRDRHRRASIRLSGLGGLPDARAQAAALINPRVQPKLSPKEMAIITCITQGKRNKEIAYQLGTTEQVIKNYLRKIYDKLGVSDRLELALYCLHNKIIHTDGEEESVVQKLVGR